jgi:cytochrome b6
LATVLIGLHLALIQRLGISVPPGQEAAWKALPSEKREMPFFPNFFVREVMAWYFALGVLGVLSAIYPWELGTKADPFVSAPAGIRPEWYFLFMFQTLKLIPAKVGPIDGELLGILGFGVVGLIWVLLPFLGGDRYSRRQVFIRGLGVFALAYVLGMTVYGYLAK